MTIISTPINTRNDNFIRDYVRRGNASSKSEVVRRALDLFEEREAINDVIRAEQDVREGRVYGGDLRKIIKKLND